MDKLTKDIRSYVKSRGVVYETDIQTAFAVNESIEEHRRINMIIAILINKGDFICTPSEPCYLVSFSERCLH